MTRRGMGERDGFLIPSLKEIYGAVVKLSKLIKEREGRIDVIVGISRGGLVPSRLFSDMLDVKDIEIVKATYYLGIGKRMEKVMIKVPQDLEVKDKKVMIVDDVADTGETLIDVEKAIKERNPSKVIKVTLYVKPWSKVKPDYFYGETEAWIVFPWEVAETLRKASEDERELIKEGLDLSDEVKKGIEELLGDGKGLDTS